MIQSDALDGDNGLCNGYCYSSGDCIGCFGSDGDGRGTFRLCGDKASITHRNNIRCATLIQNGLIADGGGIDSGHDLGSVANSKGSLGERQADGSNHIGSKTLHQIHINPARIV